MPSSNKTGHLHLNRWLGADKPKREDFVEDNLLIDEAYGALGEQLAQLGTAFSANLSTHAQNAVIHVSEAEKQTWNRGSFTIGSYQGTDVNDRKITLGYKPRFGVVFAQSAAPVDYSNSSQYLHLHFAFFSESGCSGGITLQTDGFTVKNQPLENPVGFAYKLNQSEYTYFYVLWK